MSLECLVSEWSPDTRRVLRAYLRAIAVAEPLERELARRYGVALGDVHSLRLLRDLGEVPISRLSAALCIKASRATNLVDRLEGAGLVERGADPADRRVTTLRLTARAQEALGDQALFESSDLARHVERLTPAERLLLATLLERMLERRPEDHAEPEEGHAEPSTAPQPLAPGGAAASDSSARSEVAR
jgi:DNA-binding MarR family transcriptional regulator